MLSLDPVLVVVGALAGGVIGLTGMGGGALLTPVLVLFLGVPPLTAVGSDLVVSLLLKPIGSAVHARRGTVLWPVVRWLVLGSVPAAFAGAYVLTRVEAVRGAEAVLERVLGAALLLAAGALVARAWVELSMRSGRRPAPPPVVSVPVRRVPTVVVGALGGLVVGLTSVGSGSLMLVLLLALYPGIRAGQAVGTDLAQAVPLVAAASVGHLLFGEVSGGLTASLVLGGVPGVYLGARLSARAPQGLVRRALVVVLSASGLRLLGLEPAVVLVVLLASMVLGTTAWRAARARAARPHSPST